MKNIVGITAWILITGTVAVNAQSISPEVIASAGEHNIGSNAQLSWTLGEVVIDTYTSTENILTQGFHQTQLTVTSIQDNVNAEFDVSVFPSPTAQVLNIAINGSHDGINAALFDMRGKAVMAQSILRDQSSMQWDLSRIAMGQYVLRLTDDAGKMMSSFKVVRTADQ